MPGNFGHLGVSPNFNVPAGVPAWPRLRQFNAVSQTLAANNVPGVGAVTGLGTGGAAGVRIGETNGSQGQVEIVFGPNPASGGSVALVFPSSPPTLFVAGSDAFGTISQATVSNTVTISWTGQPQGNTRHRLNYQWATSR